MTLDVNKLPNYSRRNEIGNSITHLIGLLFAIGSLLFFIIYAINNNLDIAYMYPYYLYSLSMMLVFLVSTLYHSSPLKSKKRTILRMLDHSDIYLFVCGTYFPICMYGITVNNVSIIIMILEISLATIGIILNLIPTNNKIVRLLSYIIYLIIGWLIIVFYPFNIGLDFLPFIFILGGGIVYTIGAIIYAIGKKKPYFHTVFHVFIVFAAIIQFIGIYYILVI